MQYREQQSEKPRSRQQKSDHRKIALTILSAVAVLFVAVIVFSLFFMPQPSVSGEQLPLSAKTAAVEIADPGEVFLDLHPEYTGTLLLKTEDAGKDYLTDTLFIGDSNTARYALYDLLALKNVMGVEGMGIQSVTAHPGIYWVGYDSPVTIPKAVTMAQPRRIVICFGTNNLLNKDEKWFVEEYDEVIDALEEAYPYADIILMSVPPIGANCPDRTLSNKTVAAYNDALMDFAKERDLKYLNTYEKLADSSGAMKKEYIIEDGIHLSESALKAILQYVRTHAYLTEDTRPTPLKSIPARRPAPYVPPPETPKFSAATAASYAYSNLVNSGFSALQATGEIDFKKAINSMSFSFPDADVKPGMEGEIANRVADGVKAAHSGGTIVTTGYYAEDTKTHVVAVYFFQSGTGSAVDKSALQAAIAAATSKLGSAQVAADASTVPAGQLWVTEGEKSALNAAITSAQAVYNKAAATKAEVDAATAAVNAAAGAFSPKQGSQQQPGGGENPGGGEGNPGEGNPGEGNPGEGNPGEGNPGGTTEGEPPAGGADGEVPTP